MMAQGKRNVEYWGIAQGVERGPGFLFLFLFFGLPEAYGVPGPGIRF